jgi:hypothetical protein
LIFSRSDYFNPLLFITQIGTPKNATGGMKFALGNDAIVTAETLKKYPTPHKSNYRMDE